MIIKYSLDKEIQRKLQQIINIGSMLKVCKVRGDGGVVQSQELGAGDATTKVSSVVQRHSSSKADRMADLIN